MGSGKLRASATADSEYNGGRAHTHTHEKKKGCREIKGRIEFIYRLVLSS